MAPVARRFGECAFVDANVHAGMACRARIDDKVAVLAA
jgi:hypothetical protein